MRTDSSDGVLACKRRYIHGESSLAVCANRLRRVLPMGLVAFHFHSVCVNRV